jgi:transcriptional regulator with XRE-family HTH domain
VLDRTRENLEANERAEVARQIRVLLGRSGLKPQEFASRIGVPGDELAGYIEGKASPSASLMVRMSRLSDRFSKMKTPRPGGAH